MILLFDLLGSPLLTLVDANKNFFLAFKTSRFKFISLDKLRSFRALSLNEIKMISTINNTIKSLDSDIKIRQYIVLELTSIGASFVRELSKDDYDEWLKNEK